MPKGDSTNKDAKKHMFSLKGAPRDRRSVISCSNPISANAVKSSKPQKRVQWKVWHELNVYEPRWPCMTGLYDQQLLHVIQHYSNFKAYATVFLPRFGNAFKCFFADDLRDIDQKKGTAFTRGWELRTSVRGVWKGMRWHHQKLWLCVEHYYVISTYKTNSPQFFFPLQQPSP